MKYLGLAVSALVLSTSAAGAGVVAVFTPIPSDAFRVNGAINDPAGPEDQQNVTLGEVTPFSASGGGTTTTGPVRGSVAFSGQIASGSGVTTIDLDGLADCERPEGNGSFVTIGLFENGDDESSFEFTTTAPLAYSITDSGWGNQSVTVSPSAGGALPPCTLPPGTYRISIFLNSSLTQYDPFFDPPTPDTDASVMNWRLTLSANPMPCDVLITSPAAIGATATTITPTSGGAAVPLADANVIVEGTTLTVNGRHTLAGLLLRSTPLSPAIATHDPAFVHDYSGGAGTDILRGMHLTILNDLRFAGADSRIDVSGKGYASASGPGAGVSSTQSGWGGSGGGHGGDGGASAPGGNGRAPGGAQNDDPLHPVDFGSGGGIDDFTSGSPGGGCVRLDINGALVIEFPGRDISAITAEGIAGTTMSDREGGGGAGGSIWITAAAYSIAQSETPLISARGGDGLFESGGGGGGRIVANGCGMVSRFDVRGGRENLAAGPPYDALPGQPGSLLTDSPHLITKLGLP